MEGMKGDLKKPPLSLREVSDHEIEVDPLVASIEFVTHDRVAEVRQVDADLVLTTGVQPNSDPGIDLLPALEVPLAAPTGPGGSPIGSNTVLDGHRTGHLAPQRGIDGPVTQRHSATNQGDVLLGDQTRRPQRAQLRPSFVRFGEDHDPARLPVEAVDHVGFKTQVNANPTHQTGILVSLGRMADQACRFAQDQQVCILVQDLKQSHHPGWPPVMARSRWV
jgi:hypothetical protein